MPRCALPAPAQLRCAVFLPDLRDLPEALSVYLPRLREEADLRPAGLVVLVAERERLLQLAAERLLERDLAHGGRPALHHGVHGRQRGHHCVDVLLSEPVPRRLLDGLVPQLVPENGHADQLARHQQRLVDQRVAVLAHLVEDAEGGGLAHLAVAFAGHGQRVHERLRVGATDARQQLVQQAADGRRRRVDPRDDLRDHGKPRVDADAALTARAQRHARRALQLRLGGRGSSSGRGSAAEQSRRQRGLHLPDAAVLEPECEQSQHVLSRVVPAGLQPDGAEEALDGSHDVFGDDGRGAWLAVRAAR